MPASTKRLELLLFGGTLLLYIAVTLVANRPDLIWDEGRYLAFARNLTQGFYADPKNADIINGPGYPLLLAVLLMVKAPLIGLRMVNALFMALAAWFSFRAVKPYAGPRWALGVALITALHPNLARTAPYLMTEALAVCCIAGFAWSFSAALRPEKANWLMMIGAAVVFASLTMTRVFFGNVIMASVPFLVLSALLVKRERGRILRALTVMLVSFGLCVPWLAYTKDKTGENLCWSTVGGELLYWMTSTHEGENGHWFSVEDAQTKPELVAHHRELYLPYYELPVKEREERFKQLAAEQLKANPAGVFKNWICNWGRLIIGHPRSFERMDVTAIVLLVINGPIVLALLWASVVALRRWREVPPEIWVIGLLSFIYIGGSSVAPGLPRYTVVLWPWIGLGIATMLSKKPEMTPA
ncbi:glycosyltransferase family 39 protein [Prosthecobacter sp.]|uniref:ArnT family glycosyltransferase n=1 Tax=Prosthecobacter sp. TaxID=1965333 RepID=UPI0025E59B11|nr:glycosyltransferase family 39 protein [Prosthecobacter sp.]